MKIKNEGKKRRKSISYSQIQTLKNKPLGFHLEISHIASKINHRVRENTLFKWSARDLLPQGLPSAAFIARSCRRNKNIHLLLRSTRRWEKKIQFTDEIWISETSRMFVPVWCSDQKKSISYAASSARVAAHCFPHPLATELSDLFFSLFIPRLSLPLAA